MASSISSGYSTYFDRLDFETKQELEVLFQNVSDTLSQNTEFCQQLIKVDDFFKSGAGLPCSNSESGIKTRVRFHMLQAFNRTGNLNLFLSKSKCATTLAYVINEKFKSIPVANQIPAMKTGSPMSDVMAQGEKDAWLTEQLRVMKPNFVYNCLCFGRLRERKAMMDIFSEDVQEKLLLVDRFAARRIAINEGRPFQTAEALLMEIQEYGEEEVKVLLPLLNEWINQYGLNS